MKRRSRPRGSWRREKTIKFGIIDYGAGNLGNVHRALNGLGVENSVVDSAIEIKDAQALILPGVGSFAAGMEGLEKRDLVEPLCSELKKGKHLLGICLGMQLLFESSEEAEGIAGLELLPGKSKLFPVETVAKVPHMGWNDLKFEKNTGLISGLENFYFYFVHSYYLPISSVIKQHRLAVSRYRGIEFVSAVKKDNITALQPHPEKSGSIGLKFLRNFVEEVKNESYSRR
ncbi:glutamine amidotransferase [Halarsenatibacter silvermanii]|uniref:Imidazole glycerol phosphate synthase subunit HisH n=2 Tax=Halarsenatibacter silvermanii TaxID=321763 RepID=A0A1G9NGD4_9FIRM|nr:glutamine amidotransferase [Halarsenatibacter silvermanii]